MHLALEILSFLCGFWSAALLVLWIRLQREVGRLREDLSDRDPDNPVI